MHIIWATHINIQPTDLFVYQQKGNKMEISCLMSIGV